MPELVSFVMKKNTQPVQTAFKQRKHSIELQLSDHISGSHPSAKRNAKIVATSKRVVTHQSALAEIRLAQAHMHNRSIIIESIHALSVGCPQASATGLARQ